MSITKTWQGLIMPPAPLCLALQMLYVDVRVSVRAHTHGCIYVKKPANLE